jgi:hypothetical protein
MSDGPNIIDFLKGKASNAANNIVGGAANAAANSANNAFKGVKLPDVNVAIAPETKKMIYTGLGILAGGAVITALIIKK